MIFDEKQNMHFTIKSSDLNQEAINAIQERFGDAQLVINVESSKHKEMFTEESCWALIKQLDWNEGDDEQIVAPLISSLVDESVAHIYQFSDWLAKKLWLLDTPAYAKNMIAQDDFLSVDDFLYARCAVVANGETYYGTVLNNPEQFPTTVTFLSLLYAPLVAFEKKTKEEMVYIPLYNYETYGNKKAWGK